MTILYHSTRGNAPELDLRGVTMAGLASDGGLYLPKEWPQFSASDITALKDMSYVDAAMRVLRPFMDGCIPDADLKKIMTEAYAGFNDPAVTPIRKIDDRLQIMELFHGPTLAFKDVALQALGGVFEYFLKQNNQRITVIGATSGDTGSAAMAALANRDNVDVFILYPNKGPSDIQRKQMTCIDAPNVHAIAVEGTFDDCQAIVKAMFNDEATRKKYNLATVNSINWLRILMQMVYYFVAASKFDRPVSFVVPTGNFGNVFAAYAATRCGLPVSKLVVASNSNDILTRFFETGSMKKEQVQASLSPSMDIQISSNFERYLFDLCEGRAEDVRRLMKDLGDSGEFFVSLAQFEKAKKLFAAARVSNDETLSTISVMYRKHNYLLDPHSAVGVAAMAKLGYQLPAPIICLACAHPAKFPDTVKTATGVAPPLPGPVVELLKKPERTTLLPPDRLKIEQFLATRIR